MLQATLLILVLANSYPIDNPSNIAIQAEFQSKEACQAALKHLATLAQSKKSGFYVVTGGCFPK